MTLPRAPSPAILWLILLAGLAGLSAIPGFAGPMGGVPTPWRVATAGGSARAPEPVGGGRVLLLVVDGLRPDYVTPELMPRLNGLAERGVRGTAHHAVVPTVTRVNGPSIFTGRYPSGHGQMGNSVYLPEVDGTRVLDAGDAADLRAIDRATGGRMLTAPSLGELLEERGKVYFAASSGSTGSGTLMNHRGAGAGLVHHALTLPDTLAGVVADVLGPAPEVEEGSPALPLVARAVDAVLRIGVDRADADVLAAWLTEPDGTAHDHGMGAPETVAVLRAVDAEIGRLLDGLAERGVLGETNVLVTSDHGFSTRVGSTSVEELMVGAGLKASDESLDVVVSGRAIHVREGGAERVGAVVELLQRTGWIGPVFTAGASGSDRGRIVGTAAFEAVGWQHARSADVLTFPDWSDEANEHGYRGVVHRPGVAGHGTASPWDIRATFIAAGRAIKRGVVSAVPTGNIDLTPTALHLMGTAVPGDLDGRVLREVLADGPPPSAVEVRRDSVVVERPLPGLTYRLTVRRSRVGSTMYVDGTEVRRVREADAELGASTGAAGENVGSDRRAGLSRRLQEVRRWASPHARQAPAADSAHVFAVTNQAIGKVHKVTGELVAEWVGEPDGPVLHLNSGIVLDGLLYSAHSNYPDIPMVSSIEIWDAATLEHVGSHSFGIFRGSATWIDRHDGSWWVAFANYEGRGGQPGRGPSWTTVVRFDGAWRPVGGYAFPPEVVERFGDRSNSGGAWGPEGHLWITGHDAPELYVLRLPDAGSVFELVEVVPAAAEGQGIAWDPVDPDLLYTLLRDRREIVASRLVRKP